MKTRIQFNKEDAVLELSDDTITNDNFVVVRVIDGETFVEAEVFLDDLLPAVEAYVQKRAMRLERESLPK